MPNVSGWILGEIARQIMRRFGDAYEIHYLSEVLARRRPDLLRRLMARVDFVHALSESSADLVLREAIGEAPPLLTWIHHVTRWTPEHASAARGSRMVIATTVGWRDTIREHAPDAPEIRVVSYGVDPDRFRPVAPRRRRFGIPADAFVVGFIAGRPSDADGSRKGLDTLRQVLARIRDLRGLHVCLVGPGWGDEAAALRSAGISANHLGFVSAGDLPSVYASLDVYLTTSRVEGGPCTVLEAMACEVPVVATRVGMVPMAVEEGVSGFVADPGDFAALADAVRSLAADPGRRRAMGAAGRARVARTLSWSRALAGLGGPYEAMSAFMGTRAAAPSSVRERRRGSQRVHAADAFLWSGAQVRSRALTPLEGVRMLGSQWRSLGLGAIMAGTASALLPARRSRADATGPGGTSCPT
jgi:glycosyltransferase involved in cell wall biosynthesis